MASLSGITVLWNNISVAANDFSTWAYVPNSLAVVFIDNLGVNSHTFRVQVAYTDQAGLNEINAGSADGGLQWFDLLEKDNSAPIDLVATANANVAYDLSPFAPRLMRLLCTVGTANNISAWVQSYGPN